MGGGGEGGGSCGQVTTSARRASSPASVFAIRCWVSDRPCSMSWKRPAWAQKGTRGHTGKHNVVQRARNVILRPYPYPPALTDTRNSPITTPLAASESGPFWRFPLGSSGTRCTPQ